MATEPQRSETTATAASSSEPADWPTGKSDVSADTALILAALGRLATAVRDERAMLARLRQALGDMAHAIATAKAVADSETAAALLDEFEHRVDAMIEIAGGHARVPAQAEAVQPEPVAATSPASEPEATIEPAVEPVPDPGHAAEPEQELEQVPTVSGVMAPQMRGEATGTEPTAAPETADDAVPTVAMLTAMVEALRDSIPSEPEPPPPEAEREPEPFGTVPTEIAPADAEQTPEPHRQPEQHEPTPVEWSAAEIVADVQPTDELATPNPPTEAALAEPSVTETAAGETPIADTTDVEPAIAAPVAVEETFVGATAAMLPPVDVFGAALPPEPAVEAAPAEGEQPVEHIASAVPETVASPEPAPVLPAAAPSEQALMQESRLLASMERIEARPFAPPETGTVVIFTQAPPPDDTSEPAQPTDEPAEAALPTAESAVEPPPAEMPARMALPEPSPVTDQPPLTPAPAAETETEFDPSDFLFGPEPEPEPAAFLLEPSPEEPPTAQEPAAAESSPEPAQPDAAAPHDPLHALKAMTPDERLAVFS